jgi:TPR repeat protein
VAARPTSEKYFIPLAECITHGQPDRLRRSGPALRERGQGLHTVGHNLGLLYLRGKCVRQDTTEARRLFEQGIALNDAASMNGMGAICNEGDGVPRNLSLAREWFEKAAALGDPEAKQNLREMRR